jgi:hypothetical protein
VSLEPALDAWLARTDHEPVTGWAPEPPIEELHCHPDLIERVALVARPITGTVRVFVAGCPVIHHPSGPPIAAASGTAWFVVREHGDWAELDPWQPDVALTRGIDLLRIRVAAAFARVEDDTSWR